MSDAIICVDLDNTLIDSVRRSKDEVGIAAKYGLRPEVYTKSINELFRRHGNMYSFQLLWPILLEKKAYLPEEMLNELNELLDKTYFFGDTDLFLQSFKKEQLILVTSGDPVVQARKLYAHKLDERFDCVFLNPFAKTDVIGACIKECGGEKVYFVDDAPREIEAVKKTCPQAICVQVREPPPWEEQKTTDYADYYFWDLAGTADFIKSNP